MAQIIPLVQRIHVKMAYRQEHVLHPQQERRWENARLVQRPSQIKLGTPQGILFRRWFHTQRSQRIASLAYAGLLEQRMTLQFKHQALTWLRSNMLACLPWSGYCRVNVKWCSITWAARYQSDVLLYVFFANPFLKIWVELSYLCWSYTVLFIACLPMLKFAGWWTLWKHRQWRHRQKGIFEHEIVWENED